MGSAIRSVKGEINADFLRLAEAEKIAESLVPAAAAHRATQGAGKIATFGVIACQTGQELSENAEAYSRVRGTRAGGFDQVPRPTGGIDRK